MGRDRVEEEERHIDERRIRRRRIGEENKWRERDMDAEREWKKNIQIVEISSLIKFSAKFIKEWWRMIVGGERFSRAETLLMKNFMVMRLLPIRKLFLPKRNFRKNSFVTNSWENPV